MRFMLPYPRRRGPRPGSAVTALVRPGTAVAAFAAAVLLAASVGAAAEEAAPGPEIVFAGGGSDAVVCIAVAVPVGSACEPVGMKGASHLVEHLVFDGSERYTREDISRWADDAGAFLNAFTRKETTVYFLVVPSALFEKGLEVLSQMLLHSTFPSAEIAKERSVILEEMRRERDDPGAARERVVESALYRGSGLGEPISGYPGTIETMTEADIKGFYRRRYLETPLRVILMGGVDPDTAEPLVGEYFARAEPAGETGAPCAAVAPRWTGEIAAREGSSDQSGFDMIVAMPAVGDRDFPAAVITAKLLEADDSPLAKALAGRSLPAPEIGLETAGEFSALTIHVKCPDSLVEACRSIPGIVAELGSWKPDEQKVERVKTAFLSSETFDREMYHFYIMSHGEAIALHGSPYIEALAEGVPKVRAKDCARLLRGWLRSPSWNACLVSSRETGGRDIRESPGSAPFISTSSAGSIVAGTRRERSSAAAIHLLLKGRSCLTAPGAPGLVELLLTALEGSPAGEKLASDLEGIGARVSFGDNPYVPQDDYLLNPSFAFIRLEAPVEGVRQAADMLGLFLAEAPIAEAELDQAKTTLMGELGMRGASPFYMMRAAMAKTLFAEHPFGAPIFPPPPVMGRATLDDLTELRGRLFARGNVIATIVSPLDDEAARSILDALLARLPVGAGSECPSVTAPAAPDTIEKTIRKEGAYLAAGWYVPCASVRETAAAIVAGETLARRMQLEMREKQGLAYSIDCGVTPLPGGAMVMAYLATSAARLSEAREALDAEIRGLGERAPEDAEIATARNRLAGKRSRSELSSANAAYVLGFDLLLGGGEYRPLDGLIAAADPGPVRDIMTRFLLRDRASIVVLAPEKK